LSLQHIIESELLNAKKNHRADAHFVDPLMDVASPREIHLAFYSLIKLFTKVEAEQNSLTWNHTPELPSALKGADIQQVCWQPWYHVFSGLCEEG
jgi:hypothetical protein